MKFDASRLAKIEIHPDEVVFHSSDEDLRDRIAFRVMELALLRGDAPSMSSASIAARAYAVADSMMLARKLAP